MKSPGLAVFAASTLLVAGACTAPGFGLPTTRELEAGVASGLDDGSFEVAGTYTAGGKQWTVDLQVQRSVQAEHLVASSGSQHLEALVTPAGVFFRGREFLAVHLGQQPAAAALVAATGDAWWRGPQSALPDLPDLTRGSSFRATFLGPALNRRRDGVLLAGVPVVELAGPRATLWVEVAAPHHLVGVRLGSGAAVDGVTAGDLRFSRYGADFRLAAPPDVIDFSDLSSLPPLYTVLSVDASNCATPCVVSAVLRNLGGLHGAVAPSTITFTLYDSASGSALATCTTTVIPDVGYNDTTTVSCTMQTSPPSGAAKVTAVPTNPGRGS